MSCEAEANDGIKESEMDSEEQDDMDMLIAAMRAAQKAFVDFLDKKGLEPAYFDLELNGFFLDDQFQKPIREIKMPAQFQVIKEFNILGKLKNLYICDDCSNTGVVVPCNTCHQHFCVECWNKHERVHPDG